jgi:hypothetical protein
VANLVTTFVGRSLSVVAVGGLLFAFIAKNYHHGNDELRSRTLWARQNGRMLDFVRDHAPKGCRVYQFCDDPECSISVARYIEELYKVEIRDWFSLPIHVPRIDGKWDPTNRPIQEIHSLFSKAQRGDLLLVPVTRANVSYIRMPLFSQASQLFPRIVPPGLQKRLRCIYSEYEQFKHMSIPPQVEAYLVNSNRRDVLSSLRASGMQLGFGWQVYQVQ